MRLGNNSPRNEPKHRFSRTDSVTDQSTTVRALARRAAFNGVAPRSTWKHESLSGRDPCRAANGPVRANGVDRTHMPLARRRVDRETRSWRARRRPAPFYRLILARLWRLAMPSKPVNVKQVLVYLTHEQHARLQRLKEKTGAPMSESIRRAIDRYLASLERRR